MAGPLSGCVSDERCLCRVYQAAWVWSRLLVYVAASDGGQVILGVLSFALRPYLPILNAACSWSNLLA